MGIYVKKHQNIGTKTKTMTQEITLTTGIYDLIKDLIRRKKVTLQEEERLLIQLKNAKQVVRKSLPLDVVTVDAKVTVKNLINNQEEVYTFVAPARAKRRKCAKRPRERQNGGSNGKRKENESASCKK